MYDGHWFGGGLMWLFWILLILIVVWAIRGVAGSGNRSGGPPSDRTALQILEERLARGEIDEEEFERKRQLLKGGRP